jgi:SRSO17 transposase
LFTQERVATNAGLFLEGLLGDEQRKTGWMRAEAAGDPGPWRQQAILGRGDWDADALRDIVRDYVIEGKLINCQSKTIAAMGTTQKNAQRQPIGPPRKLPMGAAITVASALPPLKTAKARGT